MNPIPSLHLTAGLEELFELRQFVEETALTLGIEQEMAMKLLLAVDEAATNIIIHGYRRQKGNIEVEMRPEGPDLVISLRDEAPLFDPTRHPPPDVTLPLEQRQPGGLGIYLMRQVMDEVIHRTRAGGGNELIMIKRKIIGQ
jgi:serine/threonine-protein kinase RsbW